ncbi:hypothetical protein [Lolliginicoccus suaedae]|uniref:hypothetical protein n=1 Tax=Lolliginicoccus suaedae TaxID=2605429 RepID=UPI0011EF2D3C|nr:hypothetical protein [Lolliginicoccus suaedae]
MVAAPLVLCIFLLSLILITTAARATSTSIHPRPFLRPRLFLWSGITVGIIAASWVSTTATLGRGPALAAPVLTLAVLGGVIAAEVSARRPRGPVRTASLTARAPRRYLPPALTGAVLASVLLLGVLMVLGARTASSDDLGRQSRTLVYRCGELIAGRVSPWPGTFYTVPLAEALGAVIVLSAIGLWALTHRPPTSLDPGTDTAERHRSASRIIAAAGLATAVPLAGYSLIMAAALRSVPAMQQGVACAPAWPGILVPALIATQIGAAILAIWCLAVLLAPLSPRTRETR